MKWVFFDLDGTLADSIPTMFRIYDSFLRQSGSRGSTEEFDNLNGPSIEEFVPILKRNHGLSGEVCDLIASFQSRIDQAYRQEIAPYRGAGRLLETLKQRGHGLILVTAGRRSSALAFIERQGWSELFSDFVFGDDVDLGKPAPDPYLLAMARAGLDRPHALVVEDSPNGVRAARAAGAYVVGLVGSHTAGDLRRAGADRIVEDLESIATLEGPLAGETEVVAVGSIEVRWTTLDWRPRNEEEVERAWDAEPRVQSGKVFDSKLLNMHELISSPVGAEVVGHFVGYREYFVQQQSLPLQQGIRPVGVSGITFCVASGREHVLVARRTDSVTAYPGRLELVPSGSLDEASGRDDGRIDFTTKLREEFGEETGLDPTRIRRVEPFGVVYDPLDRCYDVCCRIDLDHAVDLEPLRDNAEYRDGRWIPTDELPAFAKSHANELVPTFPAILTALGVTVS